MQSIDSKKSTPTRGSSIRQLGIKFVLQIIQLPSSEPLHNCVELFKREQFFHRSKCEISHLPLCGLKVLKVDSYSSGAFRGSGVGKKSTLSASRFKYCFCTV